MATPDFLLQKPFQNLPFGVYVAQGQLPQYIFETKFGDNPAVGSTEEDIWSVGGVEDLLSAAETMNITSTDTDDTSAGSGAQTVRISGLDNNFNPISEVVTMDGTNNVLTSNAYLRVFRMQVITAGATGANEGDITATASSAATVHAQIDTRQNQTTKSQFCIRDGYYGLITGINFGSTGASVAKLRVRPLGETFQVKLEALVDNTNADLRFEIPLVVAPKSDVKLAGTSGGTANISGYYQMYLVRQDLITEI